MTKEELKQMYKSLVIYFSRYTLIENSEENIITRNNLLKIDEYVRDPEVEDLRISSIRVDYNYDISNNKVLSKFFDNKEVKRYIYDDYENKYVLLISQGETIPKACIGMEIDNHMLLIGEKYPNVATLHFIDTTDGIEIFTFDEDTKKTLTNKQYNHISIATDAIIVFNEIIRRATNGEELVKPKRLTKILNSHDNK